MTTPIRWASIHFSRYDTCFSVAVVFAVLVTAAALLSGCQSMTGETAGENLDDAAIMTAVKAQAGSREASHPDAGRRRDESPHGSSDWGRNVRCLAGPSCRTHQDCEGRPRRAK